MNKCYWVYTYFITESNKIFCDHYFHYGEDLSRRMTFNTFESLYEYAEDPKHHHCKVGRTWFKKRRYVELKSWWDETDFEYVYENDFSKVTWSVECKEFQPTVEKAMQYLTVEQFKEYAGFTLENKT